MPVDKVVLNPPIQYQILWFIIGSLLVLSVLAWFGWLLWYTGKRRVKTIETLKQLAPANDLTALKIKYLNLIEECYQQHKQGHTDIRGLHRGLSMAVRYFVYEARHFPAPRLTLQDLYKAPYPKLTSVIKEYYSKEFDAIAHGDAESSAEMARELVRTWV